MFSQRIALWVVKFLTTHLLNARDTQFEKHSRRVTLEIAIVMDPFKTS